MDRIVYKGYQIEAVPFQLAESGEWTVNIHILRDKGYEINVRSYSAGNRFKSEDEAIRHCLDFGKRIIDGQIENLSVDDL